MDRGVVALDLADGTERWRAIPADDVTGPLTVADGAVYAGGTFDRASVIALDAAGGDERWRFDAGVDAPAPAVADGLVYVDSGVRRELGREREDGDVVEEVVHLGSGVVYALDADSGEVRWHASVDSAIEASVAATDESVYVAARESLTAFDADGEERWSVPLQAGAFAPTVAGDRIVVADRRRAYCFDAAGGDELWRRGAGERAIVDVGYGGFRSEPVVAGGGAFLPGRGGDVSALQ